MARRFVLSRDHLIKIAGDPDFYVQCPVFAWLQDMAIEAKRLYDESAERNCCGGTWAIMHPVIDAWYDAMKAARADGTTVEAFRAYLAEKKGVAVGQIVIYYRATKEQARPRRLDL